MLAPVFDGGVRQAQVDIATAEQKQALASYGQAGLTAFSEVEQFLDQGDVLFRRQSKLKEALQEARRAYNIAKLRYKEGETPGAYICYMSVGGVCQGGLYFVPVASCPQAADISVPLLLLIKTV